MLAALMLGGGTDIGAIIQLSLAPVFMIAGIGAMLSAMLNRLARVVDRGRSLMAEIASEPDGEPRKRHRKELAVLDRRVVRIHTAVTFCTVAALFVCLVIITLFTGKLMGFDLSVLIALFFIAAMMALAVGLGFFLAEIYIAISTLRLKEDLAVRREI